MKKNVIILTVLSLLGLLAVSTAVAAPLAQPFYPDPQQSALQAIEWLKTTHQNEDGGYSSFSGGAGLAPSDVGGTVDAMLAFSSAGVAPDELVAYLTENSDDVVTYASSDGASAGKLIWALTTSGQDPRDFAGVNFVDILNNQLQDDGSYNSPHPFGQSLVIYAQALVGQPVLPEAIDWLIALQSTEEGLDGSWDDGFGTVGNADATAMAVMALFAAGVSPDDDSLSRGIDFLVNAQLESGGWEYGPGFGQSVNSTAQVIQALAALGLDFKTVDSPFARNGVTPLDALLLYQSEMGGFQVDFGDGPFDDFFATVQSVQAVALAQGPVPELISEPVEEATAVPEQEPTVEPVQEPTVMPPTDVSAPEPTEEPATAVPEPTTAPVVEEAVPELISEPAPETAQSNSAAPIIAVIAALVLIAGGAYWYTKK